MSNQGRSGCEEVKDAEEDSGQQRSAVAEGSVCKARMMVTDMIGSQDSLMGCSHKQCALSRVGDGEMGSEEVMVLEAEGVERRKVNCTSDTHTSTPLPEAG